jgi:hypothetical protein
MGLMLGNLGLFGRITEIYVPYDLAPSASTTDPSSRLSSGFSRRCSSHYPYGIQEKVPAYS